eukprot:CAMPEP_0181216298 /NCGR_PEP_ID=MMETSP1096-20121128/26503_1 /TAXON_ID=156174 ORGANISM="Chrysochromulina ericina, Strain CCMP281" /NCGR_SAMPLE_ID=MMETSP1096 /ASSEMBLY_ACC=CAM_ASM_000453 /LENGTH=149 /DNA_ID=CAMNT_0023308273 /DNA_START=1050 /DNA_END=1499 /DNA_ORIENTATION=-
MTCRTQPMALLQSNTSESFLRRVRKELSMSTHSSRPGAVCSIRHSCVEMFSFPKPPAYPNICPAAGGAGQLVLDFPNPIESSNRSDMFLGGSPCSKSSHSGRVSELRCMMNSTSGSSANAVRRVSTQRRAPSGLAKTVTSTPLVAVALI